MKDETRIWLKYADENLKSAKLLSDNQLFNPCLQNIQQAIEKFLKAVIVEFSMEFRKTHSINELKTIITGKGIDIDLTEDECDFLDSVYLPSKYPLSSALPDFEPDLEISNQYITVAERLGKSIMSVLKV